MVDPDGHVLLLCVEKGREDGTEDGQEGCMAHGESFGGGGIGKGEGSKGKEGEEKAADLWGNIAGEERVKYCLDSIRLA